MKKEKNYISGNINLNPEKSNKQLEKIINEIDNLNDSLDWSLDRDLKNYLLGFSRYFLHLKLQTSPFTNYNPAYSYMPNNYFN